MKAQAKAFKEAGKNASAMEDTATSFNLLATIIKPFKPLLDVLGGLFQAFSGALSAALLPALKPLIELIIQALPFIMELGKAFGGILAEIIIAFLPVLKALMPIFQAIWPIILMLINIALIPLKVILKIIAPILEALSPLFIILGKALEKMSPFLEFLAIVIGVVLLGAIKAVALVVAHIVDFFTLGMAKAVDAVNAFFDDIEGKKTPPPGELSSVPRTPIGGLQEFQGGTPLITRTGAVIVHAGEEIKPAGLVGRSEGLLEELILETRRAREETRFREAFKR